MASLKTDYKDQLLDTSVNTERKYNLVDSDGNVVQSGVFLRDITQYSQTGDTFGAADINKITAKINEQVNFDNVEVIYSNALTLNHEVGVTIVNNGAFLDEYKAILVCVDGVFQLYDTRLIKSMYSIGQNIIVRSTSLRYNANDGFIPYSVDVGIGIDKITAYLTDSKFQSLSTTIKICGFK